MRDDLCFKKENVVANDTQSATTWDIETVQMTARHAAPHGGAALLRRTSVFAAGENLGAGAIHLP